MKNEENKNNMEMKKTNKGKADNKMLLFTIIIVVIIIISGIILYAKMSKHNDSTNTYKQYNTKEEITPSTRPSLVDDKPIIYLYPEQEIDITVKLGKAENITCSYPEYEGGWTVTAKPDGTLIDKKTGRTIYGLYWEGIQSEGMNFTEGFVVKGSDTIKFLEEKLEILGLNEIEAEEFIIYWLPRLQENEYNYIRFATEEEINANMPLEFSVKPDTIIRVLMQYKALEEYIEVPEQKLETPKREGFVVLEWGGTEVK